MVDYSPALMTDMYEYTMLDAALLGRPLTLLVEVHVHDEHPRRTAGLRQRIAAEPAVQ